MTEMQPPQQKKRRALKWAFGISLALNLVFIGFFAGAALRFAGPEKGGRVAGPNMQSYGTPYVRALPRDAQRQLFRTLRENRQDLPSRAERRAMQVQLIEAMRAPEFDAEAVARLLEAQAKAAQTVLGRAQTGWLDLVADMSTAERAAVADRLEEMMLRRRDRGNGGDGGDADRKQP